MRRTRWFVVFLFAIATVVAVAHTYYGANAHYTYLWKDPNGATQEMRVGAEGDYVYIDCGGTTVWMSGEQAQHISRGLTRAGESTMGFERR